MDITFGDGGILDRAIDWAARHPLHDPEPDNVYGATSFARRSSDVVVVVGYTENGDVIFRTPSVFPTGRILAGTAGRAEMQTNPGLETIMPRKEFLRDYSLRSRKSSSLPGPYGEWEPPTLAPGAPKYDVG